MGDRAIGERPARATTNCGGQIAASSGRPAEMQPAALSNIAFSQVALVIVEPLGIELSVEPGETLMDCAIRHGYYWPNICGGKASCGTCFAVVVSSADDLPPPSAIEEVGRQMVAIGDEHQSIRLACQMRPVGRAVVHKGGVRPLIDGPSQC